MRPASGLHNRERRGDTRRRRCRRHHGRNAWSGRCHDRRRKELLQSLATTKEAPDEDNCNHGRSCAFDHHSNLPMHHKEGCIMKVRTSFCRCSNNPPQENIQQLIQQVSKVIDLFVGEMSIDGPPEICQTTGIECSLN